jgi:hypothetical protein
MVRCLYHVGPQRPLQHRLQFDQRLAVDEGRGCQTQVITRGRFKHPSRHFQRSIIALVVEAAPTDGMAAFGQCLVHRDGPAYPWMPWITHLAKLSTMSVALSTCTTEVDHIPALALDCPIHHRAPCRQHRAISFRVDVGSRRQRS